MKIVIDARMINESGIGRYIRNLINELQKLDQQNDYYILHLKKDFNTFLYQSNFHKVLADFKWYTVTEQIKLPRILHNLKPDLVHFPHFNVPILYRGRFVVTIHDLIHQHQSLQKASTHGKLIFNAKKFGYKKVFETAVKKSERILVPSNFVKVQLTNEWKVKDEKIEVTPEAVDPDLIGIDFNSSRSRKNENLPDNVRAPYIFYVGNAHPHKNIENLIKVFLILREDDNDLQLVLSGKENYFWKQIKKKYSQKGIIYTDYVSDSQLVALYKNAKVYVEPSVEEGFGLPILEAMSLGCPVVSSNIGSLMEVGGPSSGVAAIYFNPLSIEDMVEKISGILNSEKLRKKLISKGKERVKGFSWEKMAQQTLEVYKEAI